MEIYEIHRAWHLLDATSHKLLKEKKPQKVKHFVRAVNDMQHALKSKNELCRLPDKHRKTIQELEITNIYDVKTLSNVLLHAFKEVRAGEKPSVFFTPLSIYGYGFPFGESLIIILIVSIGIKGAMNLL